MSIERPETNLNLSILFPLLGHRKTKTQERYIKKIEEFERKCEKSLMDTLSKLGIDGTVKTDPYSLPHTDEVVVTLKGESYLNGPYEFHRVARQIVKELLEKNVYKVRFYMFINVLPMGLMGKVEYKFRYYVHQ
jgi:hypothetical protein